MNNSDREYKDAWEEHELNDCFIDWNHWIHRMPVLNPTQACFLMNGLDPIRFQDARLNNTQDAIDLAITKIKKMLSYAEANASTDMSSSAWIEWADEAGFDVQGRFREENKLLCEIARNGESAQCEAAIYNSPSPLTTSEIAECFCEFKWKTVEQGKKTLGKKPAWLKECIATPGIQGKQQITWDPVMVAATLVSSKAARVQSIRSRFMKIPRLNEWLERWKDYEADYLETD